MALVILTGASGSGKTAIAQAIHAFPPALDGWRFLVNVPDEFAMNQKSTWPRTEPTHTGPRSRL